ncbi:hypothetical protein NHX12_011079 [Muraenolepis orangiensis]|uniref:Uncharacterized protein n=1 Tax=Muraenolepis orangiensis TaxID=630683 RepID=A0A9Q0DFQ9_9TELE|nr:hypothetical protein NHX12_011079 [Muraenolepis orangiensis]
MVMDGVSLRDMSRWYGRCCLVRDMRGVLMLCSLGEEGLSLHRYPSLLRQVRPPSDTSSHSMSFSTLEGLPVHLGLKPPA